MALVGSQAVQRAQSLDAKNHIDRPSTAAASAAVAAPSVAAPCAARVAQGQTSTTPPAGGLSRTRKPARSGSVPDLRVLVGGGDGSAWVSPLMHAESGGSTPDLYSLELEARRAQEREEEHDTSSTAHGTAF